MAVICAAQHLFSPLSSLIYCNNNLGLPVLGINFNYQINYQSNAIQLKWEVMLTPHCHFNAAKFQSHCQLPGKPGQQVHPEFCTSAHSARAQKRHSSAQNHPERLRQWSLSIVIISVCAVRPHHVLIPRRRQPWFSYWIVNAPSSTYCFESKQLKLESIYKVETGVVSCLNTLQVVWHITTVVWFTFES